MPEEEKAIEFLEKFVGNFYEFPNPTAVSIRDYEVTNIEIVLNLIKSQQEEIDKNKKLINNKNERLLEYAKDIAKKDKIIDLMATDIYDMQIECNRYFCNIEEVKEKFEKKVDESNVK